MKFKMFGLRGRKGRKVNWQVKEMCEMLTAILNSEKFKYECSKLNGFELSHEEDGTDLTGVEFVELLEDMNINANVVIYKGWWSWRTMGVCGFYQYGKTININYYYIVNASMSDIIDTIFHEYVHLLDNFTTTDMGHGDNNAYFKDGRFKGETAPWKLGSLVSEVYKKFYK